MVIIAKDADTLIKVIQFSGKKDWAVWEENFLKKDISKGFMDVMLGKLTIPKSTEVLDDKNEVDKQELRIEYSELILSFADTDAGKVD